MDDVENAPDDGKGNNENAQDDEKPSLILNTRPTLQQIKEPMGPPRNGNQDVIYDEHNKQWREESEETVSSEGGEDDTREDL